MSTEVNVASLANLEYFPYIDDQGRIPEVFAGKIGVYAIFDQGQVLQFVGYSRDVYLSLKQHLIRQPHECFWVKAQTISRPSRTILENIENVWIAENGTVPSGNADNQERWTQPINVRGLMTPEEEENYGNSANDEFAQVKIIKSVARRVEAEILVVLERRGLKEQLRFNPKLKEEGLLDLK
ncbi:GIY-YIG nuclease family protein [Umezakia ovalisporum]|jgi:hypothetical protein|uniref:GIY-YIG nuclease family protein n=1 Tax=Umezakia ovalisporum TaxID=75695 RepID=UPI0006F07051|nr:GIY-YIG nuclease family protein [Umezakia ovalisporum]MBI1242378.1 GIY-YIG nuclease family protein [Nostoc sp. RI_552]MDH6085498.1 GIY-YIG nuclease family protein [Umezakia ovalisporum TAC611]MDH6089580.1 GIY-YIG nuclease family protein [Umezakia ovalisporum Ak1311]CEJ45997.1 Nuclease subunit of the excinuclease complex (Unc haracterized protein) [Umezakia ovalisporum]